jgi:hypothetical protein
VSVYLLPESIFVKLFQRDEQRGQIVPHFLFFGRCFIDTLYYSVVCTEETVVTISHIHVDSYKSTRTFPHPPSAGITAQGADPPPFPLRVAKAGKNHLNAETPPLLPIVIGERYSQTISNLGHAALLRRFELPL